MNKYIVIKHPLIGTVLRSYMPLRHGQNNGYQWAVVVSTHVMPTFTTRGRRVLKSLAKFFFIWNVQDWRLFLGFLMDHLVLRTNGPFSGKRACCHTYFSDIHVYF